MKVIAVAVGSFLVLSNGQYRVAPWHEGLAPPLRQCYACVIVKLAKLKSSTAFTHWLVSGLFCGEFFNVSGAS